LRYRDLIAEQEIIDRDIEDHETNAELPPATLQHDLPRAPDVRGTESGEIFWQVASGDDPDMINIA
jgi:hypothetical protein